MLKLYTAETNNGQRARIILDECELPYEMHLVDIHHGAARTDEFRKINPNGRIPVLVDPDGFDGKPMTVTQSWAICLYAAEKAQRYVPKNPRRRLESLEWFFYVATDVSPMRAPNQAAVEIGAQDGVRAFYDRNFREALENLDCRLAGVEYLGGELSIADFAFYPMFHRRRALAETEPKLNNLLRWGALMDSRPRCRNVVKG
jgi:GST-like protein